ncbi:MAG: hypothetical protein M0006_15045 [Magnetospirillum sp.]|nr:hypothetical protein [Magnetospirillum sp.]
MTEQGIDIRQLRDLVVRPALEAIGLGGPAAEELMVGTILQESGGGHWLHQVGRGPAIGICQMEPATHDDLWRNFLRSRPDLASKVQRLMVEAQVGEIGASEMAGNLYYAVAMARLVYARAPEPLPPAGDLAAQAAYYKRHYNTADGAATVAQYMANWQRAIG